MDVLSHRAYRIAHRAPACFLSRNHRAFDRALMSLFRMSLVDYDYAVLEAHDPTMGMCAL